MGIRETVNRSPVVASVVIGVVVVTAVSLTFLLGGGGGGGSAASEDTGKRYFTVDDGKTYFAADATNIPPFTYEGKTAWRVRVFRCSGGQETVSHVERYNEAELARIRAIDKGTIKQPAKAMEYLDGANALEVKKPGDAQWLRRTPQTASRFLEITRPRCPSASGVVEWVIPD